MRGLFFCAIYAFLASPASAVNCLPLAPTPPADSDVALNGKVNASVDGLFKRLINGSSDIEGTYRNIASNTLRKFPNADKLYMWERVLFLQCEVLAGATDLTSEEKVRNIQMLYDRTNSNPPPIRSDNPPPPPRSYEFHNSGDHVNSIQGGSGNTINEKQ